MMTRGRRALLSGLFLLLIAGQTFDVVLKREDWPFSSYPMYSQVHLPIVVREDLAGVGADGEFALAPDRHFARFDNARFRRGLQRIAGAKDGGARYNAAIETLFQRYEELRAAGVHGDPPLLGVRAYGVEWDIVSGAVNRLTPERRNLRFYVYRPSAELRTRLTRASAGELSPSEHDARRLVPAADIVLDATKLMLDGGAERRTERDAASGVALSLVARSHSESDLRQAAYASAEIPAARGRYTLWLRGTTVPGADSGSLSVTATAGAELRCGFDTTGMGNWQDAFPAGAFAWSGSAPGAPPCVLEATGQLVTLRISARAGHVILDQIWLATEQIEQPDFAAAVTVDTTDDSKASR